MHTHAMIAAHPHSRGDANEALIRCIDACHDCAVACTSCADACVGEEMVQQLVQCIRLCLDCADVCAAAGRMATRRSGDNEALVREMLLVCEAACRMCGDECASHAGHHAHCRICAEACRACEQACRDAAATLH